MNHSIRAKGFIKLGFGTVAGLAMFLLVLAMAGSYWLGLI